MSEIPRRFKGRAVFSFLSNAKGGLNGRWRYFVEKMVEEDTTSVAVQFDNTMRSTHACFQTVGWMV